MGTVLEPKGVETMPNLPPALLALLTNWLRANHSGQIRLNAANHQVVSYQLHSYGKVAELPQEAVVVLAVGSGEVDLDRLAGALRGTSADCIKWSQVALTQAESEQAFEAPPVEARPAYGHPLPESLTMLGSIQAACMHRVGHAGAHGPADYPN